MRLTYVKSLPKTTALPVPVPSPKSTATVKGKKAEQNVRVRKTDWKKAVSGLLLLNRMYTYFRRTFGAAGDQSAH